MRNESPLGVLVGFALSLVGAWVVGGKVGEKLAEIGNKPKDAKDQSSAQ